MYMIKMIKIGDLPPVLALIVGKDAPYSICENCCTKKVYAHPLLLKVDKDWCLDCEDEHYRGDMTDKELALWTKQKTDEGWAVLVVTQENVGGGQL